VIVFLTLAAGVAAAAAAEPQSAVGPLMKLFQSGRVPPERLGTVVEMICNRGNEHDLKVVFDKVVQPDGFVPALRLNAMRWLTEAARTRKVKPAGDLAALESLVSDRDAGIQQSAIRLASTWQVKTITPALKTLALDSATRPELRKVAIEGLVTVGDDIARDTLQALVAPPTPLRVRMQAVAGLTGLNLERAATAAAGILADAAPTDDPDEMLAAFLDRKGGAEQLAAALGKQKLKPDVAKRSLRYMYSVGRSDAALSDVLSAAAGIAADAPPPTQEEVARLAEEVMARGNATRGEAIFRRKDLNCMKCHSLNRAGGQVGPDLSAVGGASPIDYVLNSILNPNLAVKEQYVTRIFVLVTGKVLTGVVVDRDDVRVNVRDATGSVITIPTADIDEEVEGKSLMPQGLTKFLTHDELLDLARFISELGKPGPYAVQTAKTIQRWRVLNAPPIELTAEVPHLEHIRQLVLESPASEWSSAYGRISGVLPLEELRVDGQPKVLILQGEIQVSAEGRVKVLVSSTDRLQTWFDAEFQDTKSEYEVNLTPGRHVVTVRVELSDHPHPELRLEFQTPADSGANYEIVGGM